MKTEKSFEILNHLPLFDSYLNISYSFITCLSPNSTLNSSYPDFVILHFESSSVPSLLMLFAMN